ncbi:MAG: Flp family type IVb pilin [Candidatus Hydrogenedentota bacterium]
MLIEILKNFSRDERGLETVEYAVMTTLIVTALLVSIIALASAVTNRMSTTASEIKGL